MILDILIIIDFILRCIFEMINSCSALTSVNDSTRRADFNEVIGLSDVSKVRPLEAL